MASVTSQGLHPVLDVATMEMVVSPSGDTIEFTNGVVTVTVALRKREIAILMDRFTSGGLT